MEIINATFNEDGDIEATVDGSNITIPAIVGNRHYDELLRQAIVPALWVIPLERVLDNITSAFQRRLEQGFIWKLNNGSAAETISLDSEMQMFFRDANALRGRGRVSPHGGQIWSGSTRFDINDAGLDELMEFAGAFGFKISQIHKAEELRVTAMDVATRQTYDALAINWTIRDETIAGMDITDWSLPDQNNGWDNDTVVQNP